MTFPFLSHLAAACLPLALMLAAAPPALAQGRARQLLGAPPAQGQAPAESAHGALPVWGLGVRTEAIVIASPYDPGLLRLQRGGLTALYGPAAPERLAPGLASPPPAASWPLTAPTRLLVLADGSILVSDAGSRSIFRLGGWAGPKTPALSVFAGPARVADGPAAPPPVLPEGTDTLHSMAQARDGAVLLGLTGKVLRVHKGVVAVLSEGGPRLGDPALPFQPTGLVELPDGSILVSDGPNRQLLRLHRGQTEVFAGPGLDTLEAPGRLALLMDGSLLIVDGPNRILRLTEGELTQFAGPAADVLRRRDPAHAPLPEGLHIEELAVLEDGAVLIGAQGDGAGVWLLTPPDPLEAALEGFLDRGKQAVRQGRRQDYQRAEKALMSLHRLSLATVQARFAPPPSRDGGLFGRVAGSVHAHGPESMVELVPMLRTPVPVLPPDPHPTVEGATLAGRLRVAEALQELQAFRSEHDGRQPAPCCALM